MTNHEFARRIGLGAATLLTASGLALGGAGISTADPVNPQQTVPGCSLQGGCVTPSDVTPAEQGAVDWARGQLGSDGYYELCLTFVYDAYQSVGVDIGAAPTALDWWNAHPDLQHAGDTNPPTGALVFWDANAYNSAGHVGIAEGGDTVISSYERSTTTVHEFSIADRNASGSPYLGWILPA